ncbi:tryptophan--tRNA ligase [Candidatus Pacearchaeota archaeon]|nr:tryptophan--tRNA ligase [Candidatus Pacearchaeota archaeon]
MQKKEFSVTPWDVKGEVDYERLVKEFGISKIDGKLLNRIKKHTKELHPMLRRGIFFAHRDLNWILDEYEKGNKFFLYTGCGPSGPIHLGHLGTWLFTKWLQDVFDVELWFQFTDDEKFLFKEKSFDEIEKWTHENILDVVALGFKPEKTHFLIDTKHAGLMYPIAIQFAKKINFSTIRAVFGLENDANIGQIFYTSMQAVPAVVPSVLKKKNIPCLIPLAIDQDPHFRIARDVYPKLGYYKPAIIHSLFMPSMSGPKGKMSSSEEHTAILTTDKEKEVENKIKRYAFSGGRDTIEEHRKLGGNPDVDVSFQYLRFLFEPSDEKLEKIEKDYRSGKMLTSELKKITIEKINAFLKEHQKKREKARKEIEKFIYKNSS